MTMERNYVLAVGVVVYVLLLQQVDFDKLEEQHTTFASLAKCQIDCGWFPTREHVSHTMRSAAKQHHPDLHRGGEEASCSIEEINRLVQRVRKHGAGVGGWLLWKFNVPDNSAYMICFFVAVVVLSIFVKGTNAEPPQNAGVAVGEPPQNAGVAVGKPPQNAGVAVGKGFFSKLGLGLLAFSGQVESADANAVSKSTVRALQRQVKHSEFSYGTPPCAKKNHCGDIISKCTVEGYFTHDVYLFWRDADRQCNSFKSPVPSAIVSTLTQSTLGIGILGAVSMLKDGTLDPLDIVTLTQLGSTVQGLKEQEKEQYFVKRALIDDDF